MTRGRRVRSNLPADVSTFVGRGREISEARRLLTDHRLVTLTGPGGVGKTRLGLRVAAAAGGASPDGVYVVELGELGDHQLLGDAVEQALGLADRSARSPAEVLSEYLAGRRLLLVLDGCEHLSDACAELVAALLRAAPELRVLATSREPLQVPGEVVLAVPPALPDDAVELFEQRARAAVPDFSVTAENRAAVAELCERLDHVPLAIELAAVRLRALSVAQLLDRLEDRFRLLARPTRADGRHATLLATVDWSAQSCSKAERVLWARASVFVGGFDLDAAEHVCAGGDLPADELVDTLTGLVDKSILGVRRDGRTTRYVWLDTLRDYGRRLLAERDDEPAELRRRHRDWYLSLARTASRETVGSARRMRVMTILAREPANVRAALEYCFTEPGQTRAGLDLASAWLVWLSGALLREGRYWLERALVADTEPSADRARALWTCGWVAIEQGELGAAEHLLAQAHALAVELGDETALAWSVALTGYAALFAGDLPRARPLLEDGLARHRALGDPYGVIATLSGLSQTTSYLGDPVSEALCEEHLALGERHQLPSATSGLRNLGLELVRQGRTERGTEALREGLRLSRRTGRRMGIAGCVDILAWAEVEAGRHERAARLFGATDTAYRRIGGATPQPQRDRSRHYAALAREALGEPVFTTAFRAGQEMSEDETLDYALAQPRAAPAPAGHPSPLSDRERQIAALVARGLSDKRIAAELVISPRTAQAHVARILAKLGFANRAQIAAWHIGNSGAETLPL